MISVYLLLDYSPVSTSPVSEMMGHRGFYRLCKADIAGVFTTLKIRAHPLKIRVIPEGIDKIGVHKTLRIF